MLAIYIIKDGKHSGPYSEEEVRQDLAKGALLPSDLARQDGIDKWLTITQLLDSLPAEKSSPPSSQNLPLKPKPHLRGGLAGDLSAKKSTPRSQKLPPKPKPNLRGMLAGDPPAKKSPSLPSQNLPPKPKPNLHSRIASHANKVKKLEDMEAALAGVFSQEAQAGRDKFTVLVQKLIKPAFNEFKSAMREIGRDAVIVTDLAHNHQVLSIGLTLLDRCLSFGAGKTVKLISPKLEISKRANTRFYEVYCSDDYLCVRQRTDPKGNPIIKPVAFQDVTPKFLENELAAFFERAYPTTR